MTLRTSPFQGIAFRHVVEDCGKALSGELLDEPRKCYVLDRLVELVDTTIMGLALLSASGISTHAASAHALSTLTALEELLDQAADQMPLSVIRDALQASRSNESATAVGLMIAKRFVMDLRAGLDRIDDPGIPREPEEFSPVNPVV